IRIENLNPIFVSGLSIDQAKEKIVQRLKTLFGGLSNSGGLTADVTISKIRSIRVSVIGEAVFPGTYTIPSVATAFNLLYEAGGPTHIGTLRGIELVRGGKVLRKLDFYDILTGNNSKENTLLLDQDVLRIPYAQNQVTINGEVRNPKIFEIENTETAQNVLSYAGGFNEIAYTKGIRIDRNTEIGKQIISLDKEYFSTFVLKKGDIILVDSLKNIKVNEVIISGEVFMPGSYALESSKTLSQLIKKAENFTPQALRERILVKRRKPTYEIEILDFNYKAFLEGKVPDMELQAFDEVIIANRNSLVEPRTVQIDGEVNKPMTYDFSEGLTLTKLIILAGGLKDGSNKNKIEIARRIKKDGQGDDRTVEIIPARIAEDIVNTENDVVLQPFDRIYVRKLSQYEGQKQVNILGEVMYPGPYTLEDKKQRISDLIEKAGGLKNQADIAGAKFTRDTLHVGIDLTRIIENPKDIQNLLLVTGDVLEIPRKKETVKVRGAVFNEITVPFDASLNLRDYIDLAGGVNDSASTKRIYVKYGNGTNSKTKTFLGLKVFPKISNGSEIYVPTYTRQRMSKAEIISISTAVVSLSAVLLTLIRLL
ncbi:MAG: SLBB domain-containing protein, partial [Leadbetterella sp.]